MEPWLNYVPDTWVEPAKNWAGRSLLVAMEYPVKLHSHGPSKGLPVYEDHFGQLSEGIRSSFKADVLFWNEMGHVMVSSVFKQHFTLLADLPDSAHKVAIYNASLSRDHRGTVFTTDERSEVLVLPSIAGRDFYELTKTCAGLGALGRGAQAVGWRTAVANDKQETMCDLLRSLADHPVICGDIAYPSTVKSMFESCGRASTWAFGFNCQSFSRAGDRKGGNDDRAMSLAFGLHASFMTDSPITVLECVSEAPGDVFVRTALQHHCNMTQQCKSEVVLELNHLWPSNRSRWWCVLSHEEIGKIPLSPLPRLPRQPVVSDLFDEFGNPDSTIFSQLVLTQDEYQQLNSIGVDIKKHEINRNIPLPTAMHSWANQLGPCECKCRPHGLSHDRLIKKGYFGVVIAFKSEGQRGFRHISSQELALLCGLPVHLGTHHSARLEVAAVGQLASPVQSVWIFTAIRNHLAHRQLGNQSSILPTKGVLRICEDLFRIRRSMHPIPQSGLAFDLFEAMVLRTLNGEPSVAVEPEPQVPSRSEPISNDGEDSPTLETEANQSGVKRTITAVNASFADQLQAVTHTAKKSRAGGEDSVVVAASIPGAVAGFGTITEDLQQVNPTSHEPEVESPSPSIREAVVLSHEITAKQHVCFFKAEGFCVTPQELLERRLIVVNAVDNTITAVKSSVGMNVQHLVDAEFGRNPNVKAWSVLGHSIAMHDLVDNWQCIVLSSAVPDIDEQSCESAQIRLYRMPRFQSLLHQGSRVAVDEMNFYLQSFAAKYDVHNAMPFVIENNEDVVLLADAWLDVASESHQHAKVVSAMLVGGHWTPIIVKCSNDQYEIHTDPVGETVWKAFNVPGVTIHSSGCCNSVFTNDCGFQSVAWISHFLEDGGNQVMSYDAAASLRFMFWQDLLMNTTKALHLAIVTLGGHPQDVQIALAAILREHGVFSDRAMPRASAVLDRLGVAAIEKIIHSSRPWIALKQQANQLNPKLQLVQEDEFQKVVAARSRNNKPVGNKRNVTKAEQSEVVVQPDDIVIPAGVFKQDDGSVVHQIQMRQIGSIGKGLVVCGESEIRPYLEDGLLSKEGLAFAVVNPTSAVVVQGIEVIRFPATCMSTGEPILVSAALLQKGQQQVTRVQPDRMTKVEEVEVATVKLLVYRDQWNEGWENFSSAPVKHVLQQLPVLTVCKNTNCSCPAWHLSEASTVREDPVLDVWSRDFLNDNFKRVKASDASLFTCHLRIMKAVLPAVMQMSGVSGIYVEPRTDDGRSQSTQYHTVWLPKGDHAAAVAAVAKAKHASSLIRVNRRYGVKTLAIHAAAVHAQFRDDMPFLQEGDRATYVIGPPPWRSIDTTVSGVGLAGQTHPTVRKISRWQRVVVDSSSSSGAFNHSSVHAAWRCVNLEEKSGSVAAKCRT